MATKTKELAVKVLESVFFKQATKQASKYATGSLSLLGLLKDVLIKATDIASKNDQTVVQMLVEKLTTLGRMIKSYAAGEYKLLPLQSLLKMIAVLIYFVSPIDLIPDFIPVFGFTDDLAVVMWLFGTINEDIEAFRGWELKNSN
jgi:uncharacterized membrane protein YkvA (DUF1232 family)